MWQASVVSKEGKPDVERFFKATTVEILANIKSSDLFAATFSNFLYVFISNVVSPTHKLTENHNKVNLYMWMVININLFHAMWVFELNSENMGCLMMSSTELLPFLHWYNQLCLH